MSLAANLLGLPRMPLMARPNYILEIRHLVFWGMFVGMFEGTISSIVVAKTFGGSDWLITFVMATPMLANLLGGVWGSVLTGRRKVRLLMGLGLGAAAIIGTVALAPMTQFGGYVFAGQILLARGFLAGCITARSAMWKHNYPTRIRGQIAARLQIVRFSMAIGVVLCVGALFDVRPDLYIWIYPATAVIGGVAVILLRPMRVRGEETEIASILATQAHDARQPGAQKLNALEQGIAVLRDDPDFRHYCLGMMFLGFANIMVMPLMTIIVTKQMALGYAASASLLEVLPRILMMASMLPWARLFDKRGAVHFRVSNAIAWTGAAAFAGIGAAFIPTAAYETTLGFAFIIGCIAVSRACEGLGKGGGAIAWNLGHLHFAKTERADVYMGTHVFLTGLRGLTAPFFGTWLYIQTGAFAFAVAVGLAVIGMLVFRRLAKVQGDRASLAAESAAPAV